MKKRFISLILAVLLLFSCVAPQSYVAAADVSEKKITVDADGTVYSLKVYEGADGTIYVPTDTVARLGGMTSSASSSDYTFYYKSEVSRGTPLAGARRIIIDKSGKTGKVVCYTSGSKYTTIESISFSKAKNISKKLYLPIEEFLPLLDAKVEITSDGIVHIYKNPVPLYRALFSSSNLDLYEFDKDYFVLNDVVTATGLIVDSILGFRFDRLDFVTNSGAIKDYSSLFKKLLTDNETYLSAFDKKETPVDKAMNLISDSAGDLDDAIGGTKKVLDMAKYMTTSSEHDTYKTFSDEVKKFGSNTAYVEGAIKVIKYADVYYNQVDDHRNMLTAVYSGGSSPAAVAANQTYNVYGKDMAGKVTSAATSVLRDYITKEVSGAITKGYGLTPYKIAFSAVKLLIPDAVKEFSSAAEMYFLDKVVEDAYDTSKSRLNNMKYDKKSLENLRLSLIMYLVASKHGHESYGTTGPDDMVSLIDSTLEDLYLAADSVECVAKGYYAAKKNELSKSKKYINPVDISNNSTSTTPSEGPSNDPTVDPSEGPTEPTQTPDNALSGKCGNNITWTFADGTLTISGTGRMDDYNYNIANDIDGSIIGGTVAPWFELDLDKKIHQVVINEGVTSIGREAFFGYGHGLENLKSISIPDSVTEIGSMAFMGCYELTEVVIGENSQLAIIGDSAFCGTSLSSFTIPTSIRELGRYAFHVNDSVTSLTITYNGSISAWNSIDKEYWGTPPSIVKEVICTDGTVPIENPYN